MILRMLLQMEGPFLEMGGMHEIRGNVLTNTLYIIKHPTPTVLRQEFGYCVQEVGVTGNVWQGICIKNVRKSIEWTLGKELVLKRKKVQRNYHSGNKSEFPRGNK